VSRRRLWLAAAAVAAVAAGTGVVLAVVADSPSRDGARSERSPSTAEPTRDEDARGEPAPPAPAPVEQTLLVWTAGGLPAGLAERVDAVEGVERVTTVRGDVVGLTASFDIAGQPIDVADDGLRIPLDAIAIDPATYPGFFEGEARARLEALAPGEAALGSTSAGLRRMEPGGTLRLVEGTQLTVTGVVDDRAIGAAELVVHASSAESVGIRTPRFLLVGYTGDRALTEQAITANVPGLAVRFRSPGETQYLRHGDLVLPQARIKELFGEFAYRPGPDRFFTEDPAWQAEHIATATVPVLGPITCHRAVLPAIEGALRELEQRGLAALVDPAGYQGCWVPNEIPGGGGISRHSWGVAIDLNFVANPTGLASFADPRLVEVMERWGFISGGRFLTVDPGHFEYVGPPRA
jgi:D-alanyl-D-alanine carboxypeptidase